jgi:sorbose reductase
MPDLSLFDLSGKKALITGGSTGIGRSCALALARAGADVAIVDVNEEAGQKTVASLKALGRDSLFVRCDVSKRPAVYAMVEAVVARFGRLDIAVNTAGIYRHGDDENQSLEDWQQVIDVNLTGTWLCAQAEMRQMIKQTPTQGKIINIGSIAASIACSNGAYDAAKAGVVHMSRTLAARWGRYNINVNCVSPGYVGLVFGQQRSLEERKMLREFTPLGHVQRVQDLEGPVLFFASQASDYVTGQNVVVDGGHTLSSWTRPLERSVPPRISPDAEITD